MHRGFATTMDITCELHLRKPIERLGIAPMTSMYWYSESVKAKAADWRPEIHDSDGLAIWAGTGEHLWRPLINPPALQISTFLDATPKGFGLMQRDHNYDHYLDAVYYERRPCAWVEPIGDWGKGSVQLLEIPTNNEIYDNVVAMWVPAAENHAGDQLGFRYRLYWRDKDPFPGDLALCVATRLGMGAVQGAPRSKVLRKFLIEFQGTALTALDEGEVPEPVVTVSRAAPTSHFITETLAGRCQGPVAHNVRSRSAGGRARRDALLPALRRQALSPKPGPTATFRSRAMNAERPHRPKLLDGLRGTFEDRGEGTSLKSEKAYKKAPT